jgi:hypothetical protein
MNMSTMEGMKFARKIKLVQPFITKLELTSSESGYSLGDYVDFISSEAAAAGREVLVAVLDLTRST